MVTSRFEVLSSSERIYYLNNISNTCRYVHYVVALVVPNWLYFEEILGQKVVGCQTGYTGTEYIQSGSGSLRQTDAAYMEIQHENGVGNQLVGYDILL